MKNLLLSTAVIALIGFSANTVQATTLSSNASATILSYDLETITEIYELDFGSFLINYGATDASVKSDGSGNHILHFNGHSHAYFEIAGEQGLPYLVDVDDTVLLTETGGETLTASLSQSFSSGTFAASPRELRVVGTIEGISYTQAIGVYNGTYHITVAYQ